MEYGKYGGAYVPESVLKACLELEEAFDFYIKDEEFQKEYLRYLKDYVGRPSALTKCENLSKKYQNQIYLKREDLNHTGAHKINNCIGQVLLAKRMNKKKVVAETGAGQHGVATATVAALFGMECIVFMGEEDVARQNLNVKKMELLGAKVVAVKGEKTATLADAVDFAINYWVENVEDTFYLLGSAVGPNPYPKMVKAFQEIISIELKAQILEREGRLPDMVIACVGGGSNAIGAFAHFIDEKSVKLYGAEAAGLGIDTKKHAATLTLGKDAIHHGMLTKFILNDLDEIEEVYSISAGLDYPGVGPEHAYLDSINRVDYSAITDSEAIEAFKELSKLEGIIPAIESSHALALCFKLAKDFKDQLIVVNLSGRGDKDMDQLLKYL